jgi:hypothetical protein
MLAKALASECQGQRVRVHLTVSSSCFAVSCCCIRFLMLIAVVFFVAALAIAIVAWLLLLLRNCLFLTSIA